MLQVCTELFVLYVHVCITLYLAFWQLVYGGAQEKGGLMGHNKLCEKMARFNIQKIILCLEVQISISMVYDLDRRHHALYFTLKSVTTPGCHDNHIEN